MKAWRGRLRPMARMLSHMYCSRTAAARTTRRIHTSCRWPSPRSHLDRLRRGRSMPTHTSWIACPMWKTPKAWTLPLRLVTTPSRASAALPRRNKHWTKLKRPSSRTSPKATTTTVPLSMRTTATISLLLPRIAPMARMLWRSGNMMQARFRLPVTPTAMVPPKPSTVERAPLKHPTVCTTMVLFQLRKIRRTFPAPPKP
mmetsp:Transcript_59393/g.172103  ORF Transcript_59393/g.172103 Transcript_59393/m.172103 type:complete len:200 (+) Transcript_59393:163-762(+)